jgi:pyruvate/2-oxoglutarate dehydrogenase complex dihydrolipoamide dehydrogenase (E3) component
LGSHVHLISRQDTLLSEEDPEVAELLGSRLERDGVRLHLGCQELTLERAGNLSAVIIGRDQRREKLLVERVLLCGARLPRTADLGLEAVAVAYDRRGVAVGDRLQTTARGIFAAGEVCGPGLAELHAAEASARLAVHNALSILPRRLSRMAVPRWIRTEPAVVQVGFSRQEAQERQLDFDTCRAELSTADASLPEGRREGFVALHVLRRTGRIVGATVVAEGADELIAPVQLVIRRRRSLWALAQLTPCRPSRLELLVRLAERYPKAGGLRRRLRAHSIQPPPTTRSPW